MQTTTDAGTDVFATDSALPTDAGPGTAATDTAGSDPWGVMTTTTPADATPADTAVTTPDIGADPFATGVTTQPEAQIDTPVTAPVTTTAVQQPAVDTAALDAMKAKVADLEKTIAAQKKEIATLTTSLQTAQDKAAAMATTSKPVVTKTATAKQPVKAAPKKSWVLRSAQPGKALVAEVGSNELRSVAVGDTLAGIGKVTDIGKDSAGKWVVNGTRGKINQ
jgi:hypothetical protein